jgi:hypothetical protein
VISAADTCAVPHAACIPSTDLVLFIQRYPGYVSPLPLLPFLYLVQLAHPRSIIRHLGYLISNDDVFLSPWNMLGYRADWIWHKTKAPRHDWWYNCE